jgi:hypothetical protein
MALLLLEGFDGFNTVSNLAEKHNVTTSWANLQDGRFGGKSFYGTHASFGYIRFYLPTDVDTVYVGFAVYPNSISNNTVFAVNNVSGGRQCGVAFNYLPALISGNGSSVVQYGDGNTLVLPAMWNYIEIKATVNNSISADDFIVRVNGDEMLNVTAGTDTQYQSSSGIRQVVFYGLNRIDDVYICDTTGSKNNTFLGDTRVSSLLPNAVGANSDFTPTDGTSDNYTMVDDATDHDNDTTYVESSSVGDVDLYNFENISETPNTIDGVSVVSSMKKTGAGARTAKIVCQSDGTNEESTEISPSTDYQYLPAIYEDDPATGTAWTESGLNAAQFGIKVES